MNEELHRELLSIERSILEVQRSCTHIEATQARLVESIDDHEKRLRTLEADTNKARGAVIAYTVLSGTIVGVFSILAQVLLS